MIAESCRASIPVDRPTADFDCFSYGGQSGSPIWTYDGNDRRIRGILTSSYATGDEAGPGGYTIVTESLFESISGVLDGSGGFRKRQ